METLDQKQVHPKVKNTKLDILQALAKQDGKEEEEDEKKTTPTNGKSHAKKGWNKKKGTLESTNNKFDTRLKEIYNSLVIEGPIAGKAKTGMDIALKLAQDYEAKPLMTRNIEDRMTGGSGRAAKKLVKKYLLGENWNEAN